MALGVGLYGQNGHQIYHQLEKYPLAQLVATAAIDLQAMPESLRQRTDITHYATLDELIADPRIEFISLCSPRRADQAQQAIRIMNAGKHVYAEKPCALNEDDLDELIATSQRTGRVFGNGRHCF